MLEDADGRLAQTGMSTPRRSSPAFDTSRRRTGGHDTAVTSFANVPSTSSDAWPCTSIERGGWAVCRAMMTSWSWEDEDASALDSYRQGMRRLVRAGLSMYAWRAYEQKQRTTASNAFRLDSPALELSKHTVKACLRPTE
ncbi:hypothetical protein SCHPADRAFT_947353 [Schizopora paradoxa]|uniref:Uncharacterized protein n=1 Tax=Schizopora paradoxa TaxID=27342 RepID=A0A0H2R629_9AGAM|nr:hypothetical protein SCHPADRAFT_947353 [Schizopora paradoxa]